MGDWTFFSNHGHVLVCLARDADARLRDVAVQVGITERAVQKIVRDLQDEGFLEITKHGRRNRYRINNRKALRHPLQAGCTVGQLLNLLSKSVSGKSTADSPTSRKTPKTPERLVHHAEPKTGLGGNLEQSPRLRNELPPGSPASESEAEESTPKAPGEAPEKPANKDLEQGQLF
ncbi:MAG: hypothetical protein R3212_01715 [Xanthomonadales bacterium]|nr:hypothetical protein [Xanthomonadales bacterium]